MVSILVLLILVPALASSVDTEQAADTTTTDVTSQDQIDVLSNTTEHISSKLDNQSSAIDPLSVSKQSSCAVSEQKKKIFTLFSDTELNWFEALVDCKRRGLRLATIESEEELEEVVKLIRSKADPENEISPQLPDQKFISFWLSGSDLGNTDDYVWMTTGQPLNYTAWYPGKPDHVVFHGETEHCIALRSQFNYRWNDHCCSEKNFYVCDNHN